MAAWGQGVEKMNMRVCVWRRVTGWGGLFEGECDGWLEGGVYGGVYLKPGAKRSLPPKSPQSHPVFIHHDVDCSYTLRARTRTRGMHSLT